jgi:beta-mannanase
MFDYFTYEKGLNNLLWVYAPARLPCSYAPEYYYPGDDYVDIVGLDYYLDTGGLDLIDERGRPELLALGKPFALTEFGPTGWYVGDDPPEHIPSINSYDYGSLMDKIRELCPEVGYFLTWWDNYSLVNQLGAQGLLDDPWVITRDKVDWRTEMETRSIQDVRNELDAALTVLNASVNAAQAAMAEMEASVTAAQTAMVEMEAKTADLKVQTAAVSDLLAELQDLLTG